MVLPNLHVVIDEPDMHHYQRLLAQALPQVTLTLCETPATPPAAIARAEILLTWRPHAEVLQRMTHLKWIHCTGAGVEAILRSPHYSPHVILTRTGRMAPRLMAEYVAGFILANQFQIPRLIHNQQQRRWQPFPVPTLKGKHCTVLGMGDIGQAVAEMGQAIGLEVTGVSRQGKAIANIRTYPVTQLDALLPTTDILVIVVPLTRETEGMIHAGRLRLLPPHALLINISRGPVVVEADLIHALQAGSLGGAILDVFDEEPLPPPSPLWAMENVIITPHIAGPCDPTFCTQVFLDNLERWSSGRAMRDVVDPARGY